MGGYYAYVQFPSGYTNAEVSKKDGVVGSEDVARYLATELGVVCLPGSFFMPDFGDEVWDDIEDAGGGELKTDRWLRYVLLLITYHKTWLRWADGRFAIANVDDEVIVSLEPRLRRMNELMGVS